MNRLVLALLAASSLLAACGGSSSPAGPDGMIAADGAGSSSQGGDKLYPLSVGEHWTFTVTTVGAGSTCAAGTYTQSVVSANAVGGRPAFQMTSFCTGVAGAYDYAAGAGDEVDFYYNGTWAPLIDGNLTEGHSWSYFNTSYHWERTTVAGHSDCWKAVQDVSYTAYLTYCRGAGLVESYSMDLAGNGWDAKLD